MEKKKFFVDTSVGRIEVKIKKHKGFYLTKTKNQRGILVTAVVTSPKGIKARGEAMCHPSDIFNYGYGAQKALQRALKFGSRKNVKNRRMIWEKFFEIFPKETIECISWMDFLCSLDSIEWV